MKNIRILQLVLREEKVSIYQAEELEEVYEILNKAPGITKVYQEILKDITGGSKQKTGAEGMTVEQVVKLVFLRKRKEFSYRALSDQTVDSISIRRFLDLKPGQKFSKSAIQSNLKKVKEERWVDLNKCLIEYAKKEGLEDGKSIRTDTTTSETNIHYPTDSSLMNDCVRVLTRNMRKAKELLGLDVKYVDHTKRIKGKLYKINNIKGEKKRRTHYIEMIRVSRKVIKEAGGVAEVLKNTQFDCLDRGLLANALLGELNKFIPLAKQVINQAYKRIVQRENVSADEKLFSIFETHTDIIVKGSRDVVFGHKVLLSSGRSNLILSCNVLEGNPADKTLVKATLDNHTNTFGKTPEQSVFDGGFASYENRDLLKQEGVKEVTFCKNLKMKLDSLVSSPKVHKLLMRFRAGVEGNISFLKRVFSLSRVFDRSKETFKSVVQSIMVACNLTLLARYSLAKKHLAIV